MSAEQTQGIHYLMLKHGNPQCPECNGYQFDDGTCEICHCDDICPICEKEVCEPDCEAYEDGY